MVRLGKTAETRTRWCDKPKTDKRKSVYPLLKKLTIGKDFFDCIHITDSVDDAIDFITSTCLWHHHPRQDFLKDGIVISMLVRHDLEYSTALTVLTKKRARRD